MDNSLEMLIRQAEIKNMKIRIKKLDEIEVENLSLDSSSFGGGGWYHIYGIRDKLYDLVGFIYITINGITLFELVNVGEKK